MCGRFVSAGDPNAVADYMNALQPSLDVVSESDPLGPNYNVAPTQDILAVVTRPDGDTKVVTLHWGLVPSWAKDRKVAAKMINARAETLDRKPAFKKLFAERRCLIPMEGFYEWRAGDPEGPLDSKGKPRKRPLYIHRSSGAPLLMAGLWTRWKDPGEPDPEGRDEHAGERWLHSATIVTTGANATVESVHDRMPVVVPEHRWAQWLDPSVRDITTLVDLFAVDDGLDLTMYPVSMEVNSVRNNGAHLLDPA